MLLQFRLLQRFPWDRLTRHFRLPPWFRWVPGYRSILLFPWVLLLQHYRLIRLPP